jgi:hypothetical protein
MQSAIIRYWLDQLEHTVAVYGSLFTSAVLNNDVHEAPSVS